MFTHRQKRKVQNKVITYRSYKNFNREQFLYDLASAPFYAAQVFDTNVGKKGTGKKSTGKMGRGKGYIDV